MSEQDTTNSVNTIMVAPTPTPEERERLGIQSPEQLRQIPIHKEMIANHIRQQQSLVDLNNPVPLKYPYGL